jgi:hypothetical protein
LNNPVVLIQRLAGVAWRDPRLAWDQLPVPKAGRKIMLITRRGTICNSAFALGRAVLAPQFAKADTAAAKPLGQNAGIYRLRVGAFEVTVLNDGFFTRSGA